jgi:hypothetical protein
MYTKIQSRKLIVSILIGIGSILALFWKVPPKTMPFTKEKENNVKVLKIKSYKRWQLTGDVKKIKKIPNNNRNPFLLSFITKKKKRKKEKKKKRKKK